jgi:hypothetical protein
MPDTDVAAPAPREPQMPVTGVPAVASAAGETATPGKPTQENKTGTPAQEKPAKAPPWAKAPDVYNTPVAVDPVARETAAALWDGNTHPVQAAPIPYLEALSTPSMRGEISGPFLPPGLSIVEHATNVAEALEKQDKKEHAPH